MKHLLLIMGISFIFHDVSCLPEQNQWTTVLKSRRDVFNLTRSLYVNSTIYLHVACRGQRNDAWIKYFVGFVELPCLSARLGNVTQYKYVEDGMGDDNDYRMLPWQTAKCSPSGLKLPVMKGAPGSVYDTKVDSVFFLTIKILEQSPATTLYGTVYTRSLHGHSLSPIDWPLLPLYSVIFCVDVICLIVWLACCCSCSQNVHYIHRWITFIIAIGTVQHLMLLSTYAKLDNTAALVTGLLFTAELLSCIKRTMSRTLFILASLHIHFPTLSVKLSDTCRVLSITVVYLAVSSAAAISHFYMPKYNDSMDDYRTILIVYCVDVFICLWIFRNVFHATNTTTATTTLYRRVGYVLLLSVTASLSFLAWSVNYHLLPECITAWRTLWLDEAFWHVLFAVDIILIMIVCRPTSGDLVTQSHH